MTNLNRFSSLTEGLEQVYHDLQSRFDLLKERVHESLFRLEEIVGQMSEGLLFVTLEGTISLFNVSAEKITGLKSSEILEKSFWAIFDDTLFGFSMKKALETPAIPRRVFLTLNEVKEIEISTSSIAQKGILLLLRDRTELHMLERTVSQNERLKELSEMGATLAHEIRNPLGGITGFASLLKRELSEPHHIEMIDAILQGTELLNHLVTRVLEYARPSLLHFAPTDLVTLIREVMDFVKGDPIATSCRFEAACSAFWISADQNGIKTVLLNFLRNAFEAKATTVTFILEDSGMLSISDNGCGIAEKDRLKLFTPFFSTKSKGTGLGLARAHQIITQHGGVITVESVEGKGTTFRIRLCPLKQS